MTQELWLVEAWSGSYEDRQEWISSIWDSKEKADAEVKRLEAEEKARARAYDDQVEHGWFEPVSYSAYTRAMILNEARTM